MSANGSDRSNTPWATRAVQVAVLIGMLAPLVFVGYLGTNSRYLADDFCTAGRVREAGFWSSQGYWYRHWSGRFAFTFIVNVSHLVGPGLTPILPALVLALWLGSLFWLAHEASRSNGAGRWRRPAILAGAVLFVTVATTPKLYQSILWQTGLLTYSLPLVLFACGAAWTTWQVRRAERRDDPWQSVLIPGALAFVAGGMSETYVAVQTAFLAIALLGAQLLAREPAKRRLLSRHLVVALTASIAAGIIVAAAPGNAVRQGALDRTDDLFTVLQRSLRDVYLFSAQRYNHDLLWTAVGAGVPFLVGAELTLRGRERLPLDIKPLHLIAVLVAIPLVVLALILVTMAPSEYALSSYPDGRILITAHYAMALGLAVWGAGLGYLLARWIPKLLTNGGLRMGIWLLAAALVFVGVIQFVGEHRSLLEDARTYARRWDERHRQLSGAPGRGEFFVEAASLSHMGGLAELSRDPGEWINGCVADTYGVREVRAK